MPPLMICEATGVTAANLTTTTTCRPCPPLTGRAPQALYEVQVPRSPAERLQVRMAKQAIWPALNEVVTQPFGSPQVAPEVRHVPHDVPGPSDPQAASVFGMPVLGSARMALPMSLVSEMIPIRTPARAAPAASIDSQ